MESESTFKNESPGLRPVFPMANYNRWKRKSLSPADRFIRNSAFIGQKTLFSER